MEYNPKAKGSKNKSLKDGLEASTNKLIILLVDSKLRMKIRIWGPKVGMKLKIEVSIIPQLENPKA